MNRPEEALQKQVVQFLEFARVEAVWFHVPNQRGTRKAWEVGLLTAMGVRPGVADLVFAWEVETPHGDLARVGFIELKAGTGKPSAAQENFEESCCRISAPYAECTSVESVERTLRAWGVPLRASVLPSGVFKRNQP